MKTKEYRRLHAEWYELVSAAEDHSREIDFWVRSIRAAGEPALELGSGTGRVLIPLLEQGFDVVGIDTSEDMMARCRAACRAKGLRAELHEQTMTEFTLPREFGLVILDSGGLGLFVSDQEIRSTFERVMAHVKPGGWFIFEFQPEPSEDKGSDDREWSGDWVKGPDDTVVAWRQRWKYDAATHIWKILFVVEKFIGGRLVETEVNERTGRFFTVEEAVRFAESAGFTDARAFDWLTEDPPGKDSKAVTVRCRKPRIGDSHLL